MLTKKQKEKVIEIRGGICEIWNCLEMDNLEVHHIKRKSKGGSDELKNLLVLCEKHHKQIHSGEKYR